MKKISKKYLNIVSLSLLLAVLSSCGSRSKDPNMATINTNPATSDGTNPDENHKPNPTYHPPVTSFSYVNPVNKSSTFIFDSNATTPIATIKPTSDVTPNKFYEDPSEQILDTKTNSMVSKLVYYGLTLDSSGNINATPTESFDQNFKIFAKNDYNKTDPIPSTIIHIIYSNSQGLTFNLVNPTLDNSKNMAANENATYTITNPSQSNIPIQITSIKTDITVDPYTGKDENFKADFSGCLNHTLNSKTPSCSFSVSYLDTASTNKHQFAFILTTKDSVFGTKTYSSVGSNEHTVPVITAQNTIATQCPAVSELEHLNSINWTPSFGSYSSGLSFTGANWGGAAFFSTAPGIVSCNYGLYSIKSTHIYTSPTTNWVFPENTTYTCTQTFTPPFSYGPPALPQCIKWEMKPNGTYSTTNANCTNSDPSACKFLPAPS